MPMLIWTQWQMAIKMDSEKMYYLHSCQLQYGQQITQKRIMLLCTMQSMYVMSKKIHKKNRDCFAWSKEGQISRDQAAHNNVSQVLERAQ